MLKSLGIALLGLFLTAGVAWASPFLVCDPTSEDVDRCRIEINGEVVSGTLETIGDQVRIKHDLEGLPYGPFVFRAQFGNIWDVWSDWSDPLEDSKAIPTPASGLGIER